jgi:hypothetical protein
MFAVARLKIKRANKHINDLVTAIDRFVATDFYDLSVNKDSNSGEHRLQFRQMIDMPEDIPLVIGDAIHNLRTALDFVATEIIERAGRDTGPRVKFPFYPNKKELICSPPIREIEATSQTDIVSLIINDIRPYPGGNDSLYALHKLDITDKHHFLVPNVSVTELRHVNLDVGKAKFRGYTLRVSHGGVLNVVGMSGVFDMQGNGDPAFDVLFQDGPLNGRSVIPTLHQLSQLVTGTVDAIEKAYSAGI